VAACGAVAVLAAVLAPRPALANEVVVNESVCGGYDCVDGYEIKCKQPARYLCVTIDASPSAAEAVDFYLNVVETAPVSGLGTGFMRVARSNVTKKSCVARPAHLPDGGITALAIVGSGTVWPGAKAYRVKAECASWATGFKVSKRTKVVKKRDN
jgi:hypothetical protein